jgi:isocitrate/isopropylmalate dehydrogenase
MKRKNSKAMNEPRFEIVVIKGDGIGIDVTDATLAV